MSYIENLKQTIKKLKTTGFFSIFLSNILAKVIAFLGNIVIVRILSKNDYGIYSYALNAMTILFIFNDFGAANAALQSLTEQKDDKEKQKVILKYALKIGMRGSLFSGALIALSPFYYPFNIEEARYYTPILFLVPVLTNINSFILVVLRSNLENNKFAFLNCSSTFFNYMFLIILARKFGIMGAIISQYCYMGIQVILGVILTRNVLGKSKKGEILDSEERKAFLKYALTTQLNSTLSSILLNFDIFLIGILIANSSIVASYKVASTIPMALAFLPNCVMIYVLPYFVMHNKDKSWLKAQYIKLIKIGALAYGILTVFVCLFSKTIFHILYSYEYNDAITAFNILMIGFFFSATFKIPTNNILYSMRKLKINLIVTISSASLNIILNTILIHFIGMNGAALSTMFIHVFGSCILLYYAKKILKGDVVANEENSN